MVFAPRGPSLRWDDEGVGDVTRVNRVTSDRLDPRVDPPAGRAPILVQAAERFALPRLALGASAYLTRSTCSNSSSTGVARPKMETPTLTRPRSKSSSSTRPLKLANGPSRTLTLSPIS